MKNIKNNKKKFVIIGSIIFVIMAFFALNKKLQIKEYIVKTNKIESAISIMLITDLHSSDYAGQPEELVERIKGENPDIVLFGGDIVDDILPLDITKKILESIANVYPCYYVSGNHEFWSGDIDGIKELFRSYGVTVLAGERDTIEFHGQKITICGVDDEEIGYWKFRGQIESAQRDMDTSLFTILLAHRPEYIDTYLTYDFDLILAGHAHGGQWRIPFILNGLYVPDQGVFPKYAGGLYAFEDTTFIISRGLSNESAGVPRIFNPPELVLIEIQPK